MVFSIDEIYKKNTPRGDIFFSVPVVWETGSSPDIDITPDNSQTLLIRKLIIKDESFIETGNTLMEISYPILSASTTETKLIKDIEEIKAYSVEKTLSSSTFIEFTFEPAILLQNGASFATFSIKTGGSYVFSAGTMTFYLEGWKMDTADYD